MPAVQSKPTEINPKFILPFFNSVRSVLKTMANLEATVGKPSIKVTNEPAYDYSGIISFSGKVIGTVVVSFHRDAAVRVVAAFAGGELAADTSDFADALGELANMIAGAAKKELGVAASISVPTVIMGKGHVVARPAEIPCVLIPCKCSAGEFAVEVGIKAV